MKTFFSTAKCSKGEFKVTINVTDVFNAEVEINGKSFEIIYKGATDKLFLTPAICEEMGSKFDVRFAFLCDVTEAVKYMANVRIANGAKQSEINTNKGFGEKSIYNQINNSNYDRIER